VWLWRKKPQQVPKGNDLRGALAQKRLKTYSASSGLVYQYFYCGYRETGLRSEHTEYVFQASADRKHYHSISVVLAGEELEQWSVRRGRRLTSSEKYAVAKMSLFAAFDQEDVAISQRIAIRPDAEKIDEHLEALGRL
jgi:hypothetical protein